MENLNLTSNDIKTIAENIINPPAPNEKLKELFTRYHKICGQKKESENTQGKK